MINIEKEILSLAGNKNFRRSLLYIYSHRYGSRYNYQTDVFDFNGNHVIENDKIMWHEYKLDPPKSELQKIIYNFWLDANRKGLVKEKYSFTGREKFTEEIEDIASNPGGIWYIVFEISFAKIKSKQVNWKPEADSKPKKGTSYIEKELEIFFQ